MTDAAGGAAAGGEGDEQEHEGGEAGNAEGEAAEAEDTSTPQVRTVLKPIVYQFTVITL